MAAIGFELHKLLRKDSLTGTAQAYLYAALIGSGPLVLSIVGILLVGLMSQPVMDPALPVSQFQVSVTWLIAASLILTGGVQLGFTRFVSDRLFEQQDEEVLSNLNGLLLVTFAVSGGLGFILSFTVFSDLPVPYRLLMMAGFVLLCGIWITTILLSGLKLYKDILVIYAVGYSTVVVAALLGRPWGLSGLLGGFVLGQALLLAGCWLTMVRHYRSPVPVAFSFFRPGACFPSLLVIGLLYNLGVWADKLIFWLWPWTSSEVIGPLRASVIYDLPVFMAYLFIIPGMAVFLVRIETDFVEHYNRFFDAVRSGGSLSTIETMRDEMVTTIRQALGEIAKVQTVALLLAVAVGGMALRAMGISDLYLPLFHIQTLGASLQVGLLALISVLFYLDQRRMILFLCLLFCAANISLTILSLRLGAAFYGYGYACALLLTLAFGLFLLDRKLGRLEYETFMLQ